MFESYEEILKKRGYLYHEAMTLYPNARKGEFNKIIEMPISETEILSLIFHLVADI
jgi:hypothetical protein